MMWTDYYLQFPDAASYTTTMPEDLQNPGGPDHATDVIGTLYRHDTFAPSAGFHVNLRLRSGVALPEALAPYVLPIPDHPKRVFA